MGAALTLQMASVTVTRVLSDVPNETSNDVLSGGRVKVKDIGGMELTLEPGFDAGNAGNVGSLTFDGQDFRGADLSDSQLWGCWFYDCDLRGVSFRGSNLRFAHFDGCRMEGADLSGADLRNADFRDQDLVGIVGIEIVADAPERLREVARTVLAFPERLNMGDWHICETVHCIAGWGIFLAGEMGRAMEKRYGSEIAGMLLLGKEAHSHFFDSDERAMEWLRGLPEVGSEG